ncbi:MAG: MFS family permease [Cyclobacteriaceae bacterium]|jgi:MFS family permease
MSNQVRITLISFLAYFIMSGMLSPIGIIIGPMAEHFEQPITVISSLFSWLTFGILLGSILALVVFDWLALKPLLLLLYTAITLSLMTLSIFDDLQVIAVALGLVGVCCGIGLAGAATIISTTYEADRRASMLVITDGSFSIAGIVCSSVAIYLLSQQVPWFGVYAFVALIGVVVVLLTLVSRLPRVEPAPEQVLANVESPATRWPVPVWLCIGSLFLYTLGQYSLLWWLPTYIESTLLVPREQAGEVVSQFWSGMFVAQLFVAWWVLKIGVQRLIIIGSISTSLCSIPLWLVTDIDALLILAFVWGVANLGLLKIIISFATLTVSTPTPRLVSGLLLGATLGTALSPWVTSYIVEVAGAYFVLQFGTACYVVLSVLLLVASRARLPAPSSTPA